MGERSSREMSALCAASRRLPAALGLAAIVLTAALGCASADRRLATIARADDGTTAQPGPAACGADRRCAATPARAGDDRAALQGVARWIAQSGDPTPDPPGVDADGAEGDDPAPAGDGPAPAAAPSAPAPPPRVAATADERWLPPVEDAVAGDGKLASALDDVAALTREAASAVGGADGCAARVQAFIDWAAKNGARASRLSHRVLLLSEGRNHRYTEADKAAIQRHEAAYEGLGEALLARCDEDGPELARLETVDVMVPHTFHRLPETDPFESSTRCVGLREVRLRALIDPVTLRGARAGGGLHATTVSVKDMDCQVSDASAAPVVVTCRDALGSAPKGYATQWGFRAGQPMGTWRGHLTKLATRCMTGGYAYTYEQKADGELTALTATGDRPHVITVGPAPGHGGRFVWSLRAEAPAR